MTPPPLYEACRRDGQWSVYCAETDSFGFTGASEGFCRRKAIALNGRRRRKNSLEPIFHPSDAGTD